MCVVAIVTVPVPQVKFITGEKNTHDVYSISTYGCFVESYMMRVAVIYSWLFLSNVLGNMSKFNNMMFCCELVRVC